MDDFLYICDDAYKREELIAMEMNILSTLKFDINIPIPYRFLRRFAKVGAAGGWVGVQVPPGPLCVGSQLAAGSVGPNLPTELRMLVCQAWFARSVPCAPEAAL